MNSILKKLRKNYHKSIFANLLAYRDGKEVPNIADSSNRISKEISREIIRAIGFKVSNNSLPPQAIGTQFGEITKDFITTAFKKLSHLRPGKWTASTAQSGEGIAAYDQYDHLRQLQEVLSKHPGLKATLGGDYLITPDIVIARMPEKDEVINSQEKLVSSKGVSTFSPLRETNNKLAILHASISCKWTMRSDRSQNTRTESLNLIRNRKGNTPHIMAVTFEPTPNRIASIALGTGDLDCTYHVALYELIDVLSNISGAEPQAEILDDMIKGRRLRDISDLPLDLAI